MPEPLLEMRGISKSFGGNPVLSDVDLCLCSGEVHALVGENGAGKSTLMKILSGVYRRDSGRILLEGHELHLSGPYDARSAGIGMIFQEHTLAPHLTVAENIFLGTEHTGPAGLLNNRSMTRAARGILSAHGFPIDADAPVERLSRAEKQLVEIARAISRAYRVLIMDEPTSMLSHHESGQLFRIIGELKKTGLAVVYISHRMEELARVADRITILRDGRRVYSGGFSELDEHAVIRHMVGREIQELFPTRHLPGEERVLEVEDLGDGRQYRHVSFGLHRGEILGLAGLVGAGRTAVIRGIFGLAPPVQGAIRLHGRPARFESPDDAIAAGLAYLTEDRKVTSLFPHLSVAHNISIAALERVSAGWALRLGEETRRCGELIGRLGIRTPSPQEPIYRLSGGNQQKSLVARWLFADSSVLLLDEPTQGVDLAARAEIYRIIQDIAARGGAVVMVSSDLPELLGMSHRIGVMRRGEIVAILVATATDQEEIMRHAALVR